MRQLSDVEGDSSLEDDPRSGRLSDAVMKSAKLLKILICKTLESMHQMAQSVGTSS